MEFTLNERKLKYEDEKLYIKLEKNWRTLKKGEWKEVSIYENCCYNKIRIGNKCFQVHRIIGYLFLNLDMNNETQIIDHINRNKTDNRLENLRIVTTQQNGFNREAKGYTFDKKNKKWRAHICINRKLIYLGLFNTEEEARQAYLDSKQIYHKI
jgi:hypothetical protein